MRAPEPVTNLFSEAAQRQADLTEWIPPSHPPVLQWDGALPAEPTWFVSPNGRLARILRLSQAAGDVFWDGISNDNLRP